MSPATAVVLTGGITAAGQWANDKQLTMRYFVGIGVLAIGLAVMSEGQPELASKFGLLVVVAAIFLYGIPLAKKLGYTK